MKTKEEILSTLKKEIPYLKEEFYFKTIGLFGSYSREEQKEGSEYLTKVERVFQTLEGLKSHFGCWERAVEYYNFKRPHMSLENGRLRTPYQAFLDKMREN